jgi:hypothetical protein
MQIKCPQCSEISQAPVDVRVEQFGCPNCRRLIAYKDGEADKIVKQYDYYAENHILLSLGAQGELEGKVYAVTGIIIKRVQGIYYWREYILTAADGEKRFLSETDGHWIFLKEVPELYDVHNYPRTLTHDDITMRLYDYETTSIAYAAGFFDYELPAKNQQMIEYVNAPYIISIERGAGQEATFFGKHISAGTVKRAFNVQLPPKMGVGIVQPFLANVRSFAITMASVAVLILITHLFFYGNREEKTVLSQSLTFDTYNNKDFVSRPFTLEGGSAPMTIALSSDVSNSWANVQVGLVNEQTNEEVYASKDIEYYSGYEGGEHWTEGSTSEKFNICGVAPGRYHLVVTPQKPAEDLTNNTVNVNVKWNQSSLWNVLLPIIVMGVIVIAVYYINLNYEQRRWADSSFSPFE